MSFHLRDLPPGGKAEVEFAPEQRGKVEKLLRLRQAESVEETPLEDDRIRILVVRR